MHDARSMINEGYAKVYVSVYHFIRCRSDLFRSIKEDCSKLPFPINGLLSSQEALWLTSCEDCPMIQPYLRMLLKT